MKTFEHEWVFEDFDQFPSFRTKGMFGGLAVFVFEKQVMVIVEPTKSGRWDWHGILICTDYVHHESLMNEFSGLAPHEILKKWLYIDSADDSFEETMVGLSKRIMQNDPRIGILPKPKKKKAKKKVAKKKAKKKSVKK